MNNLFENDSVGIESQNHINPKQIHYIQSNTFYDNQTGVMVVLSVSTCTTIVRLENNIFIGNSAGSFGVSSYSNISAETRNNVYFDNSTNVDGTYVSINTTGGDNADQTGNANPMLVHQATLANNAFLSSTTNDGFYLAQNSGDASRFPLRESSVTTIVVNSDSYNQNSDDYIYVYSCDQAISSLTELGYYNGRSSFISTGTALGNILIELLAQYDDWNIQSGDNIELKFGNKDIITVYLPPITLYTGTNDYIYLWVAQDGSVYYGDENHGIDALNQDAWFAMEYDMPAVTGNGDTGLAQGAFDDGGQSNAIDKGSVKVTTLNSTTYRYTTMASLGSTNTNGTQDNSSTIRFIQPTLTTNTVDPIGRLDIGYHYNGSVVYTIDMMTAFSYPLSGRLYTYSPATDYPNTSVDGGVTYPYPDTYGVALRKMVSGKYDSTSLNPTEMILLTGYGPLVDTSNPNSVNYTALGYHIYNTPIIGAYDEILSHAYSQRVVPNDGTLGPHFNVLDAVASPSGQVFSMLQGNQSFGGSDDTIDEFIYIYRYDDSSNAWTKIVTLDSTYYYTYWDVDPMFHGAAIAADTANLWIAAAYADFAPKPYHIGVTFVPVTTGFMFLNLSNFISMETPYISPLSMTYDASTGWVRILYNNSGDSNNMHEIAVNNQSGIPTLQYDTVAVINPMGGGIDANNFAIAYNPNDPTGGSERAYAVYNINQNTEYSQLSAVNHVWYSNSNIFSNNGIQDITYRYDGSALIAWSAANTGPVTNGNINTNIGSIPVFYNDGGFWLSVRTNAINHRDINASWHEWTDPSNSSDYSGVALCQELYP